MGLIGSCISALFFVAARVIDAAHAGHVTVMARLSEEQKELLDLLPSGGSALGGYTLFQTLQALGWRSKKIEQVMDELRELGEIMVGRGGSGGSVRHVRNDRRALLDLVAEFESEGIPCTRTKLLRSLRWNPQYLEQVLEYLEERSKIQIGPGGGGGVITLPEAHEDEVEDDPEEYSSGARTIASDPVADEQLLLGMIPSSGAISNARLRKMLAEKHGWDDERYWETRKRLRERGLVEIGAGRGGSVRQVRAENIVFGDKPPSEQEPAEPQDASDDKELLHRLPESGDTVALGVLQKALNWQSERFFNALDRLATAGLVHWRQSKVKRLPPPSTGSEPNDDFAETSTPGSPPDPTEALAVLSKFILERFDANSLERFIEMDLTASALSREISWNGMQGFADVAFRVSSLLRREGYLDTEFFDLLHRRFPRLRLEINRLAKLCAVVTKEAV